MTTRDASNVDRPETQLALRTALRLLRRRYGKACALAFKYFLLKSSGVNPSVARNAKTTWKSARLMACDDVKLNVCCSVTSDEK